MLAPLDDRRLNSGRGRWFGWATASRRASRPDSLSWSSIADLLEQHDLVVLITSFGDQNTGGGLFAFDGRTVECIDRVSSTGLCLAGDRLIRLLRSGDDSGPSGAAGELLAYDARGVVSYLRVDAWSATRAPRSYSRPALMGRSNDV